MVRPEKFVLPMSFMDILSGKLKLDFCDCLVMNRVERDPACERFVRGPNFG